MAIPPVWARIRNATATLRNSRAAVFLRNSPTAQGFGSFGFYAFIWATWIPVVITFKDYVAELTQVQGPSMYPFFNAEKDQTTRSDWVLNWKWSAKYGLQRGMIVTFWSPFDPNKTVVKRVVGIEGDVIRTRAPYPAATVKVPVGHIWVEGDGAARDSQDSNTYGPIATSLVIGKVTHIVYPFHRATQVRWWEYGDNMKDYRR